MKTVEIKSNLSWIEANIESAPEYAKKALAAMKIRLTKSLEQANVKAELEERKKALREELKQINDAQKAAEDEARAKRVNDREAKRKAEEVKKTKKVTK